MSCPLGNQACIDAGNDTCWVCEDNDVEPEPDTWDREDEFHDKRKDDYPV